MNTIEIKFALPYTNGSGDRCSVAYKLDKEKEFEIKLDDELFISMDDIQFYIDALMEVKAVHLQNIGAVFDSNENPPEDAEGWIEWSGGSCPVPEYIAVETMYRGFTDSTPSGAAGTFAWNWDNTDSDIIKYRILK